MYSIRRYALNDFDNWNDFVSKSKNGTFLFHRDFMEYHSDRFEDFSLLVFDENELIAVLPANKKKNTVYSHGGLTYGGLVFSEKLKLPEVIMSFKAILEFLNQNGFEKLIIKQTPSIYHKYPSEELSYALFLAKACLIRRDSLAVIDMQQRLPFSKLRKRTVNKGKKNGYSIVEEADFESFWDKVLIPNLKKKHDADPVHTAKEIKLLQQKFPHNIKQFNVYHNDDVVAGTTVFVTDTVAHMQYISGINEYNDSGALDFLYDHLINDVFAEKHFFDFGISNEEQGRKLNSGLMFWKEGFGARTIVQDFYEVETANFSLLDSALM
ncbi:GNAT family N-acetyltransferase [Flavobacterium sp. AG291]|uniref:GNAT family N-acetyltransferase n=1 Tax=Flavobacterium sp. AG291 TaxID=2184000 RepID=UPI000E2DC4E3|nr:GNAT family N-acetyltransferase [Flavobacterium sp. AG291]RDI05823.1 acetyltransferase (GNAT) family protein [Flavobacterium sp. AG291]